VNHHHHTHNRIETRFLLSLALTGVILVAEVVGGLLTHSLALLSDAAHVFLDVFALGLSYAAIRLASLPPNDRHTYGYHRLRVLAALANGATLLLVAFEIFREAIGRFSNPEPILAGPMLVVAVIGLVVNLIVAFVLRGHSHEDLNVRSAFLHVLGDALASVGVIVAGLVIVLTGWTVVDPLVSVLIGIIILLGSGNVLQQSVHILVEGVPKGLTATEVAGAMHSVVGVSEVHDLHVWTLSPAYRALSAHVVLEDQSLSEAQSVMESLKATLSEQFHIDHTTIQFECQSCAPGTIICPYEVNNHENQKS
jgi:cobalt-zinc-cadmium efflux system protein